MFSFLAATYLWDIYGTSKGWCAVRTLHTRLISRWNFLYRLVAVGFLYRLIATSIALWGSLKNSIAVRTLLSLG